MSLKRFIVIQDEHQEQTLLLGESEAHLASIHLGSDEHQEQTPRLASIHLSLSEKTHIRNFVSGSHLETLKNHQINIIKM
jgi:hypothetical protein